MKKITLSVFCLAIISSMTAQASTSTTHSKSTGCNYTEYMHIQGPAGTHIISLQGNGIVAKKIDDTYFQIIGNCSTGSDGTVIAKIGTSNSSYAELTIQDGQNMWNPEVINIKSSGGYLYTGIDHPLGSFEYTLKFSN